MHLSCMVICGPLWKSPFSQAPVLPCMDLCIHEHKYLYILGWIKNSCPVLNISNTGSAMFFYPCHHFPMEDGLSRTFPSLFPVCVCERVYVYLSLCLCVTVCTCVCASVCIHMVWST